jgi:hypothetical protein
LEGDEDRLALLFEITRIKNFGSQGCTATCHGPYRAPVYEYKLSTGTLAEKGGKGGDVRNETEDESKPLYMQDPAQKPIKTGFLLMDGAVKITDYSIFKAGDTIPFRLPKHPIGSRGDVKTLSRYTNGGWTLMLYRKNLIFFRFCSFVISFFFNHCYTLLFLKVVSNIIE